MGECVYLGHSDLIEFSWEGLSSVSASRGAEHGICLHSLKEKPHYTVYGET